MQTRILSRAAIARLRLASGRHAALAQNSGALAVGTVATAALGFIYWWLAARSFSPETIGKASALLSLMALVGLLGEGGLGTLLTGELMRHPGRERGLIAAAALSAASLSVGAGGLGVLLSGFIPGAHGDLGASMLSDLWLIVGCGLTGLCFVIDQAFVGMLQSTVRMLRQLLFSAGKLALLAVVAMWSADESMVLFTWVTAQLLSITAVEWLMRKRGRPLIQRPDFRLLRTLKRKAADHYLLDLGIQAPTVIMPYLVTVLLSPTSNAPFTAIWMVVSVASVVPASLATVLFPVITAEPGQHRDKMLLSLSVSLTFAFAFATFIFVYSAEILKVFNPAYVEIGGSSLRCLGFGLVGATIKFHICTEARLRNHMRMASAWFCVGGLWELAASVIGSAAGGLEGLVIGWAAGLLIEGLLMLLVVVRVAKWQWAQPTGAADPKPA